MTRIILIRHATTDTVGKRLAGRTGGIHLNEPGKLQVQSLTERLKGLPIDAIYTSPMERTRETAAPLAKQLGIEPVILDDLIELEYGEWTNQTIETVKGDERFRRYNVFRSFTRIPGGELMLEAQARMIKALEKLCTQHKDQTIAVVSHGDLIKAAVAYFAGTPLDMFQRFEISPASVSIIEVYDDAALIVTVNNTGQIQ